jgi:hypothetical protein
MLPFLLFFIVAQALCTLYLWMHESHAHHLVISKLHFFYLFFLEVVICVILAPLQLHGRRIHLMQLSRLTDELLRQRDRLQYDLGFAQQATNNASGSSDPGSFKKRINSEAPILSSSRHVGGPPSTYGTNSEIEEASEGFAAPLPPSAAQQDRTSAAQQDRTSAVEQAGQTSSDHTAATVCRSQQLAAGLMRRHGALRPCRTRAEALWETLDASGIVPRELE